MKTFRVTRFQNVRRNKSTRSEAVNKYIDTWLGSDLKGERYLTQVQHSKTGTAPSPMKSVQTSVSSQSLTSSSTSSARVIPVPKLRAEYRGNSVQVGVSRVAVPIISVDWRAPMEKIEEDLVASKFRNPCFIDMHSAPDSLDDTLLNDVIEMTKKAGMVPLATINTEAAGLNLRGDFPNLKGFVPPLTFEEKSKAKQKEKVTSQPPPPPNANAIPSLIHTGTVRSGQQLYAEGTSLIVIGSVNNGAELLADGDIHVYGKLQGRAIAGLSGDLSARIFAQQFQPSLLGIANAFTTIDDLDDIKHAVGKRVCVSLRNNSGSSGSAAGAVTGSNGRDSILDCGDGKELIISCL